MPDQPALTMSTLGSVLTARAAGVASSRKSPDAMSKSSSDTSPAPPSCPSCLGSGYAKVATEQSLYERCRTCESSWERGLAGRLQRVSGLTPADLSEKTFEHWRLFHDEYSDLRQAMIAAARRFCQQEAGWAVAYVGDTGNGKTHLLKAIGAALLAESRHVVYRNTLEYFADLRQAIRTERKEEKGPGPDDVTDDLIDVPWLLLDELPARTELTTWQAQHLDRLVCTRYEKRYPTAIASNCESDELPARIWSRLKDGTALSTLGLPDVRGKGIEW